ncbi:MAG: 50S ribosomal protein L9 [Bacteroidota bacterium]|nr:50S ribosomal protein L9 [Bacteroidota bacterium]
MEVILKKDVKKLGYVDDVVNVKPGYGRNFLIPTGAAIIANTTNKKVLAETQKQRSFKEAKLKETAEKNAKALEEMTVKVPTKAGESGKIFGSITTIQVADVLKKLGVDVERKYITIKEEPIKNLGTYTASIRLHKEVTIEVKFEVVEE